MSRLHQEMTKHLSELHLLHHKQQILNMQLLIRQAYLRADGQCSRHHQELQELLGVITEQLSSNRLSEIILAFSEFMQHYQDDDDCDLRWLVRHINHYLELVKSENSGFQQHLQFVDLSAIDAEETYQQILDPLSNQKRLDILLAINHQKKRFKELENDLQLQGGHLIYHLNPLKDANYVDQDDKKNYYLSEKGLAILEAIKKISDSYSD